MSKRMHIYAAAIDPLRKKFGICAREVAEKVTGILSHNDKLVYDVTKLKDEIAALKADATVAAAYRTAMHNELTTAHEQIKTLQDQLAARTPSSVDFICFTHQPAGQPVGEYRLATASRVDPAALLEAHPGISDWLAHVQEHKQTGVVYDGGDFIVVTIQPLGDTPLGKALAGV
jgi:hypothetical protein